MLKHPDTNSTAALYRGLISGHALNPSGRRVRAALLAVVTAAALSSSPVAAETLTVTAGEGGVKDSISAAILRAAPGDTVEVGAGTFFDCILVTKAIQLKGAGKDSTIVRCNRDTQTLRIEGAPATVEGLTFQYSGETPRATVYLRCANATLRANRMTGSAIAGIQADGCGPTLSDNLIDANSGSGILLTRESTATVSGNQIRQNGRNGIAIHSGSPTLTGNTVELNGGDGLTYAQNAAGSATGNTLVHNTGAGIRIDGARPQLKENVILENAQSGVIFLNGSTAALEKNVIHHNVLHGVVVKGGSTPAVVANTVAENGQIGIWVVDRSRPTIARNLITGHRGDRIGSGIQTTGGKEPGDPLLSDNWLWNNIVACEGADCEKSDDPGYVDAKARDYHLRSDSPALKAASGAGVGALGTAETAKH